MGLLIDNNMDAGCRVLLRVSLTSTGTQEQVSAGVRQGGVVRYRTRE